MKGYLVILYKNNKKVYERVCKSSNKINAINTALRNSASFFDHDFDSIKVYKVKLTYEIIKGE